MEKPPQPDRLESFKQRFRADFDGEVVHSETGERFNIFDPRFSEVPEIDIAGLYEHYKSTPDDPKLYFVDSLHWVVESGECLVLYFPLYKTEACEVHVRPYDMFTEMLEIDGSKVARFRLVGREQ